MGIKIFQGGALGENCYYVEDMGHGVLIDPGFSFRLTQEEQSQVDAILLTHGHFDHIGFAKQAREITGAPVYIHRLDGDFLQQSSLNLSMFFADPCPSFQADFLLEDGQEIVFGPLRFSVLHTPGHTQGSCCYLWKNCLFSGDTLMREGVGRVDFPTGSGPDMQKSLQRLALLPDSIRVYPGHGPETTISHERENNLYLRSF